MGINFYRTLNMNNIRLFINKRKWEIFTVYTILFCIIVYIDFKITRELETDKTTYWLKHVLYYFAFLSLIFHHGKNIIEIYFNDNAYSEIEKIVLGNKFVKYKETNKKSIFKKKHSWWKVDKIVVSKYDSGIWSISGEEPYLKELEKFRLRYKK